MYPPGASVNKRDDHEQAFTTAPDARPHLSFPLKIVMYYQRVTARGLVVHNHSSSFPIPLDHERSLLNTELVGFLIEQAKPKLGRANAIPAPVAAP